MDLKPIKTRKIYEEIVEQIRQLVKEGQLKAGDRLPSERELAERLQVSRASLREALTALEIMGLLEVRSGDGNYVREINIESVVAPLAWVLSMEKDVVLELLEVRKILEVQAAGIAAERITEEGIGELEAALNKMKIDLETKDLGEEADQRFHFAIARATNNKILIRLMDTISDTMQQTLQTSRKKLYTGKDTPKRLYCEHERIFDAIKKRDSVEANKQMLEHLLRVEKEMLQDFRD